MQEEIIIQGLKFHVLLPNVGLQKDGSLQPAILSDNNSFTDGDKRTPIHLVLGPKTHWKPSEG